MGKTTRAVDAATPDEVAVRGLLEQLLDDWARGAGEAYGSRFVEDADYVAFDGSHTKGRAEISASHQRLFDGWLKGTRLTGRISSIKFLSPEVALVHATGGTIMRGRTEPSPERDSIQTLVAVRRGDEWRFVALHNTRVRPIDRGFTTFVLWAVTDLMWRLFGTERRGSRA